MNKYYSLCILLGLCFIISSCRTPESILHRHYGLDIRKLDYSVVVFEEEWGNPLGDGRTLIVLSFRDNSAEQIYNEITKIGALPLPMPDIPIFIPDSIRTAQHGLYLLEDYTPAELQGDDILWNYSFLLYDKDKKNLYYLTLFL